MDVMPQQQQQISLAKGAAWDALRECFKRNLKYICMAATAVLGALFDHAGRILFHSSLCDTCGCEVP
jgi:hypothetical protein